MKDSPSLESRKRFRSCSPSGSKVQITDLPNCIIQQILEFLTVKDAIKFCALSRQWNSLWKTIANLSFVCESYKWEEGTRFASFVDKALMAYASTKIKKFSLKFGRHDTLKNQTESWLLFAMNHGVEELCLGSFDLCLGFQSVCWTSLKILSLTETRYTNENIRAILVGSPSIESLTLRSCRLHSSSPTIDATGTSLKELVIDGNFRDINILAPNLLALTVVETFEIQFKLLDVSTLMEATVERRSYIYLCKNEKKMLKGVLRKLSHINKFTVGIGILQAFAIMKLNRARFPTLTLKILDTSMELKKEYLHGVVALLSCCPDLEQLTINVKPSSTCGFMSEDVDHDKFFVGKNHWSRHLKNVKITRFVAGSCSNSDEVLVELGKYFLANAKKLEKLIIHAEEDSLTSKPKKVLKMLEITETLLCFPRASPDAAVVFKSGLR